MYDFLKKYYSIEDKNSQLKYLVEHKNSIGKYLYKYINPTFLDFATNYYDICSIFNYNINDILEFINDGEEMLKERGERFSKYIYKQFPINVWNNIRKIEEKKLLDIDFFRKYEINSINFFFENPIIIDIPYIIHNNEIPFIDRMINDTFLSMSELLRCKEDILQRIGRKYFIYFRRRNFLNNVKT